jgi:hypothetical protein
MNEKMCCDNCKSELECGGWVFNNDGYCNLKYRTDLPFPESIADRLDERKDGACFYGSCSAGLIKSRERIEDALSTTVSQDKIDKLESELKVMAEGKLLA